MTGSRGPGMPDAYVVAAVDQLNAAIDAADGAAGRAVIERAFDDGYAGLGADLLARCIASGLGGGR